MLKKRLIRKILVSISALFALFLIYIIPKEKNTNLKSIKQEIEYVKDEIITSTIFLLNNKDMLSRTKVIVNGNNKTVETKAKELINLLISAGPSESKIPSGFKAVLPADTKIISLKYEEGLLKLNLSKEVLDVVAEKELKMVEAIVYTLTSIDEVKNIILYVEGDILSKLPKSGYNLPSTLNRNIGINKEYNITSMKDIQGITIYYVDKYNDEYYYVPVTKYLNDKREKINIIIENLASSNIYNTNLMSFLNSKVKLLTAIWEEDVMKLKFNDYIFNDLEQKQILEEVLYTIGLSISDNYDVKEVVFLVGDEEIYKNVLKEVR